MQDTQSLGGKVCRSPCESKGLWVHRDGQRMEISTHTDTARRVKREVFHAILKDNSVVQMLAGFLLYVFIYKKELLKKTLFFVFNVFKI